MENLAYVTLLIQSNNEDDFESKSNDVFDDTTWSQLNNLLEPSYTIRVPFLKQQFILMKIVLNVKK